MPATIRTLDYLINETTGTLKSANNITAAQIRDAVVSVYPVVRPVPQGRLTTESGVYSSTSDRTSQSTIYFTPYNGNGIWVYDGTVWKPYTFTERSLALSGLTSGKNYDVFIYDNAGTLTLELSAAWTNDTTRADALTTQDGVLVKSGATTRLYVGTIRTTSTTATEDSKAKRFVWNAYNLLPRRLLIIETTNSWTYSSGTWRQVNANTANQVEIVCGVAGVNLFLASLHIANSDGAADGASSIGEDSTTTPMSGRPFAFHPNITNAVPGVVQYQVNVTLGYHYYAWLEVRGGGAGVMTWYGDAGSTTIQSGVEGTYQC